MNPNTPPLCIDCGLCCDGTMFHATDLVDVDDFAPLKRMGAVFIEDATSRVFLQPCQCFDGSKCSIYASRPQRCREFECALLRSVNVLTTSYDDARGIIHRARTLADSVRATFASRTSPSSNAVRLGPTSLSAYLRVMATEYTPEDLADALPDAAELISILISSFGWSDRHPPSVSA